MSTAAFEQKDTAFIRCVHALIEKSETLLEHLKKEEDQQHYDDDSIERIHDLLDERQQSIEDLVNEAGRQNSEVKLLVDAFVPKDLCNRLTNTEKEISNGLQLVFSNIKTSRQLLQKKQRSRQHYRNPYASIERDGMFVDKRK